MHAPARKAASAGDGAPVRDVNVAPSFAEIEAAAPRIRQYVQPTPMLKAPVLDRATGANVYVKCENLQRTGSFKFRGAVNLLSLHMDQARECGVVAYSSGNHAQGVAEAARSMGLRATIVMPKDAPRTKITGVTARGATIVPYDREHDDREAIARELADRTGAVLAPPYDHRDTIAGQGTVGLELLGELRDRGIADPDVMIVCAGGGGLMAGIGLALRGMGCGAAVYAAEPAGFDDHRRSVLSGKRETNAAKSGSICDAIITPTPGALTFSINHKIISGGVVATDREVTAAMAFAFRRMKLVLEPGGAVALAGVLAGRLDLRGKTVALTASGGNVDPGALAAAIGSQ